MKNKIIKKLIAIIMLIAIILPSISNIVLAATPFSEADLHDKGECGLHLQFKKASGAWTYIVCNFVTYTKNGKEYPAYCLNASLHGVGDVDYDGTLDGRCYFEQFGRREFEKNDPAFCHDFVSEPLSPTLLEVIESIEKYGGFYISRYLISKSEKGRPQSIKDSKPWVNVNFYKAENIAKSFESNKSVKSHLTYGEEYDSALSFITGLCSEELMTEDMFEWTEETDWMGKVYRRNYSYNEEGKIVVSRQIENPETNWERLGFRVVLYIK